MRARPRAVAAGLLWLLLAAAGAPRETTSLPQAGQRQQIFHQKSPSQQLASSSLVHEIGDPAEPLPAGQPLLALRAVPVSARNALSFVSSGGQPAPGPSFVLYPKCYSPQAAPPAGAGAAHRRLVASQPTSVTEVLAVEGASLRLNLAILGHALGQQRAGPRPAGPLRPALRLHWQRDGQPIGDLNLARARFSSVQLASEADPEAIAHLLGNATADRLAPDPGARAGPTHWLASVEATNQNADQPGFVLFPFADERQLEQLERAPAHQLGQLSIQARQWVSGALKRLDHDKSGLLGSPRRDSFLADGQSIDWRALGAFLRQAGAPHAEQVAQLPADCKLDEPHRLEQLMLVQLEINQLRLQDRGQYQLYACQQAPAGDPQPGGPRTGADKADCLQSQLLATISLQLVEDVPRLESWFEPLVLAPGDHFSIKCEATGFTLPQISWFLDGQLLSEQHAGQTGGPRFGSPEYAGMELELQQQGAPQQLLGSRSVVSAGQAFRIGDYVSQDNHVHSFVNSSAVRLADGGVYRCQANNGLHSVEHEARVDVRGPANIGRPMAFNLSSLVGAGRLELQCPYSGHPVGPIEWYFRPAGPRHAGSGASDQQSLDYQDVISGAQHQLRGRAPRRKRRRLEEAEREAGRGARPPGAELEAEDEDDNEYLLAASLPLVAGHAAADEQQPDVPDPDRDEWLAQASSMTMVPTPEDYPEPLPDYPIPVLESEPAAASAYLDSDGQSEAELADDYAELQAEPAGPQLPAGPAARTRRATGQLLDGPDRWTKLPQSRRHQVHPNGTLAIHDIQQDDQGLYKCHVAQAAGVGPQHPAGLDQSLLVNTWSNELHLSVLVPAVISPFSSSESLREGMRNFLTCSVIEGDSPVRLRWLKDGRPLEEHIARAGGPAAAAASPAQLSAGYAADGNMTRRIRVEAGSEYTSTLSFSQVDFRDNGNYTCVATNKAASVNYTARMVVNVPPKWTRTPKDVECVAGQSIVIDCQAEAHPNPRIWWEVGLPATAPAHHAPAPAAADKPADFQPGRPAAGPGQPHQDGLEQPPNHYRTIISNSRTYILENASLVIRDVGRQDQGYYLCQAANNFGLLSALIKLTVNVGASFASKYQLKYVRLNERVELDCDPSGQAPVTVTWFARQQAAGPIGNQLNQSYAPASLQAARQRLAHLGELEPHNQSSSDYNRAAHHHSIVASGPAEASLALHGRRRLYTAAILTDLPAAAADAAGQQQQQQHHHHNHPQHHQPSAPSNSLSAHHHDEPAGAQPAGKLIEIDSSMSFEILKSRQVAAAPTQAAHAAQQAEPAGAEIVRLHIKQARRSSSGEYICHAANQFGSDEKLIKLLVQETPDPIREISALHIDSRSVSIAWPAPFDGNSPITSYTVEWSPADEAARELAAGPQPHQQHARWSQLIVQQPAATIGQLRPMTSYEIRVIAHNQFGHSAGPSGPPALAGPAGQPLVVTTSEEAPAAPPSDIKALALSSSSVQVSWRPPSGGHAAPPAPGAISAPDHHQPEAKPTAGQARRADTGPTGSSVKGYYLGYRVANSNDSFIFKTVSVNADPPARPRADDNATASFAPAGAEAGLVKVLIGELKRSTRYSIIVQAYNSAGPGPQSDPTEAKTLLNDPPPAPLLRVGQSTFASLELLWSFRADPTLEPEAGSAKEPTVRGLTQAEGRAPAIIVGYHLYYRPAGVMGDATGPPASRDWQERRLAQETHSIEAAQGQSGPLNQLVGAHQLELTIVEQQKLAGPAQLGANWSRFHGSNFSLSQKTFRYSLDQLTCGNFYQVYLVAYNSYGSGPPSQVIRAKTRGANPSAPRRQQDFIQANSSQVKLNLAAWQDGGCPLTNFEIKYKQLLNRAAAIAMLDGQRPGFAGSSGAQAPPNDEWLLLSNSISPDQRSIELRDLQPETWFGIWVIAESAAGRTHAQYAFMTLDKLGQVPNEALEPLPTHTSNFPALFKSAAGTNSIRSILYSLSSGSPSGVPPLVLSASLCLIIFATCSLFLIRRYNSLAKDDQSIDMSSARTGGTRAAFSEGHNSISKEYGHGNAALGKQQQPYHFATHVNEETRSISPMEPHYALRASPCKTGTTVITNSSSSTNGSGAMLLGAAPSLCDSTPYGRADVMASEQHQQQQHQQPVPLDHLSQFVASSTLNYRNSRLLGDKCCVQDPKFSTLDRDPFNPQHHLAGDNMASLQNSCFRTLPHQNQRPVSTFLPPNAMQNQHLPMSASEDAEFQQRQIYSKLRLIQHYSASAANGCNALCHQQQHQQQQHQQQVDHEAVMALNQLYGQTGPVNMDEQQAPSGPSNGLQQQQAGPANEQDDYALPFPPKWV